MAEEDLTFLETLVPENVILKQDAEGDGIYFVSTGDCVVNVKDQYGNERISHRLLTEGEHFGEISTIYNCLVSATVISRSYNIMARMSRDRFIELAIEFPEYKEKLKKHLMRYKDPRINFLK
jgi:CRP-like cAMP-binding protein